MTTESIIILALVIAAAVAAVVWRLRKKKAEPESPQATPTQTNPAPAPATAPAPDPAPVSKRLTAADYSDSFFSGWLAGMPIKPYELPAQIKGYGADGAYDRNKFDPRFYDPATERIVAADGTYVDIATLTNVFPDGTSDKVAPTTIRQWLYGLSIDPASAANMGLLAQAMIDAPRSLGRRTPGEGQGDFGGVS